MSLRRELLLALTRLWDSNKQAVRMSLIADRLRDAKFFYALVLYRAGRLSPRFVSEPAPVRDALTPTRDLVLTLISKYSEGGSASVVLKKLKTLRHERLAHRQLPDAPLAVVMAEMPEQQGEGGEGPVWATDDEIEEFYQDNLEIVRLLLSSVQGVAFDLSEASRVYKHHAKYFWASARGERTEGHPDYRPRPLDSWSELCRESPRYPEGQSGLDLCRMHIED
ncbi:hypothetical protein [Pseudomonas putida]|uniref:AbiU2 domain-containing protein n=1 Tax=Pseudomonas putida TaxID=303 RepID=UPI001EDB2D02|nr:hypothetical protein [Pseudomonas putida]